MVTSSESTINGSSLAVGKYLKVKDEFDISHYSSLHNELLLKHILLLKVMYHKYVFLILAVKSSSLIRDVTVVDDKQPHEAVELHVYDVKISN
jgi:hypothetical protein